jgi:hypothetical protein
MKAIILLVLLLGCVCILRAQKYPEPEFANEVYFLKKDSVNMVIRLQKDHSRMETKNKIGSMEQAYQLDGDKSNIRLRSGNGLSFVFSNGASVEKNAGNATADSVMRANGMDPSMLNGTGMDMYGVRDPSSSIELYRTESSKGKRKIITMKAGGGMFGAGKQSSSDKYTFSVRKIRNGYWELLIDKPLPRGEYAFAIADRATGMDQSSTFFAFGVD